MSDFLEFLYYLLGFWRFVFNHEFRNDWITRFKKNNFLGKLLELLGATISTAIGIGVPAIFAVIIYENIMFQVKIDRCLDAGGSFNYKECSCDYVQSHPFYENHQCQ